MHLQRSLLILFVSLLSACGKPPKGPIGLVGEAGCIYVDPREMNAQNVCHGKPMVDGTCTLSFQECAQKEGIATTPGYDRILRQAYVDCNRPPAGPMCIVGESAVFCSDSRPMDRSNVCFERPVQDGVCDLTHAEAINFVVTTATYFRQLRDYFRRKCG